MAYLSLKWDLFKSKQNDVTEERSRKFIREFTRPRRQRQLQRNVAFVSEF